MEQASERPDVRWGAIGLICADFRCRVAFGSSLFVIPLRLLMIQIELLCQSKVCKLGFETCFITAARQHYVFKLNVAMNNLV